MTLEFIRLDVSCPNVVHKIDLKQENIISFDVLMEKNWNSPDLIIFFKDYTFRHPKGLIINYSKVVRYLKKHFK